MLNLDRFLLWIYRRRLIVTACIAVSCIAIVTIAIVMLPRAIGTISGMQKTYNFPEKMLTLAEYDNDVRNIDFDDTSAVRAYKWDQIRSKFIGKKIKWQVKVYDVIGYRYPKLEFISVNDTDPLWKDGTCNLTPSQSTDALQIQKGTLVTIEGIIKDVLPIEIESCKLLK